MNSTLIWTKTYGQVLLTARQTYITNRYSFRVLLHLSHVRFILQSCRACLITTLATRWQICGCYLKLLSRAFPRQKGKRYPGTHRFSQVSTVLVKEWPTCGLNCEFTGEDPKPCAPTSLASRPKALQGESTLHSGTHCYSLEELPKPQ